jgi:predicted dehydrogenase
MRILVVGIGGSMGQRRIRNLQALGYTDIVGYDVNWYKQEKTAEKYNIKTLFKEDIFGDRLNGIDAIIVSVPPLLKQPYINWANSYHVPVFCEADVTKYTGNYYNSATLRFHPAIQKIKEIIDSGNLGGIYAFTYHMGQSLYDWHPGCDMKTYYAAQKESGACREMFCFEMSWLSYLFGIPVDAKGLIDKKLDDPDITADDVYAATVKLSKGRMKQLPTADLPNGATVSGQYYIEDSYITGTVLIDIVSRPAIRELRIVGEKCNLVWNWNNSYVSLEHPSGVILPISYNRGKAAEGYHSAICEDMYIAEMENFINSITPCCGDCKHIDPKENHPITTGHMCTRFNHRLMHGKYHPDFCKLNECKQYLFSREDEEAVISMLKKIEG